MKIFIIILAFLFSGCSVNNYSHKNSVPINSSVNSHSLPAEKQVAENISNEGDGSYVCDSPLYSWQECRVSPVGSLINSVSSRGGQVYVQWSSNCGCYGGVPHGRGWARWCVNSQNCSPDNVSNFLGQVGATIQMGLYDGPVRINSFIGRYAGTITSNGGYYRGVLLSPGGAKFVGELNPDGSYRIGTLYKDEKIYISNKFLSNDPVGKVLVGDSSGNYSIYDCGIGLNCQFVSQGHDNAVSLVFGVIKEIAIGEAADAIVGRLSLAFPALRGALFAKYFPAVLEAFAGLVFF